MRSPPSWASEHSLLAEADRLERKVSVIADRHLGPLRRVAAPVRWATFVTDSGRFSDEGAQRWGRSIMAGKPTGKQVTPESVMDFAEFGYAFAELVLVPEVIGPRLQALLPDQLKVKESIGPITASVRGSATVGDIQSIELGVEEMSTLRRHRADVHLDLSLRLNLKVTKESYRVTGRFPLVLTSSVVRPLSLVVDTEPPDPVDIEVEVVGGGRLKLAEKVGNLDDRIRGHVVRIVEEMVAETEMHRRFDVVELVHLALKAVGEPQLSGKVTYDERIDRDLGGAATGDFVADNIPVGGAAVG